MSHDDVDEYADGPDIDAAAAEDDDDDDDDDGDADGDADGDDEGCDDMFVTSPCPYSICCDVHPTFPSVVE